MKDAYSFHISEASLNDGYRTMSEAYVRIFTRLGLKFRAVQADGGSIGGSSSQEFHVLAESGEDAIVFSDADDYAANLEMAVTLPVLAPKGGTTQSLSKVATPNARSIADICTQLSIKPAACIKTLLVDAADGGVIALVVRGDHELNAVKAQKLPGVARPLRMSSPQRIRESLALETGFIGPIGLKIPLYADHAAAHLTDFVCGANEKDAHYIGANWGRDLPEPTSVDMRNVIVGDPSPSGQGTLQIARGIEVGHIFKLGQKYSASLKAVVQDEHSKSATLWMGCYGIGITRVVAAAIEQNHDANGICWPEALAPFTLVLVPLGYQKSAQVRQAAERLYAEFIGMGIDVLLDDRDVRPGVKFADSELLGIPHRIVIGDRGLDVGTLEYRHRRATTSIDLALSEAVAFICDKAQSAKA